MDFVKRIALIRSTEGLSQHEFCQLTDLNLGSLRKWEQGQRASINSTELQKITKHPRFEKYTLWLMTDKTAPEAGQISPDIERARDEQPSEDASGL